MKRAIIAAAIMALSSAAWAGDAGHRIVVDGADAENGVICIEQLQPNGSPSLYPPVCRGLDEEIELAGVKLRVKAAASMPVEKVDLRGVIEDLQILTGVRN